MALPANAAHFLAECQKRISGPSALTDFTFRCGEKEYQVSSALVSCHSKYFQTVFESKFKGDRERFLDLEGDKFASVSRMMTYFQSFDYENTGMKAKDHVEMYLLADKYEVPRLKELSIQNFATAALESDKGTSELLSTINFIYQNTTGVHKDIRSATKLVWYAGNRSTKTVDEGTDLVKALQEIPEFTAELVGAHGECGSSSLFGMEYMCSACRRRVRARSVCELRNQMCGCRAKTKHDAITLSNGLQIKPF